MVGVGRDLCGSSSPTPLPKQGKRLPSARNAELLWKEPRDSQMGPQLSAGNLLYALEKDSVAYASVSCVVHKKVRNLHCDSRVTLLKHVLRK